MIEEAEYVLRDLGFYEVRVRHHELRSESAAPHLQWTGIPGPVAPALTSPTVLHLARIEVGAAEMTRLLENGVAQRVAEALKKLGYTHVTLDLLGYRRGSLNEPAGLIPKP
jgi:uncharacterized protein